MRITRSLVWALTLASAALPAWSQAPRLQFLNRLKEDATVSGAVTVKVSTDPILRPKVIKVAIEVDGVVKETAESLPWNFVWDSTNEPDGKHVIRLVLLNTRTNETGMVDEMRFQTSNRVVRTPTPLEPPKQEPRPTPRDDVPQKRTKVASRDAERGNLNFALEPAGTGRVTEFDAEVSRAANALEFSASSLQVEAGKLVIGRRDGSLTVFDPASRDGWSIKAPLPAGEVLAAARSGNEAVWLCASESTERSARGSAPAPAKWLFVYNEKEKKVRALDLTMAPTPSSRVSLWLGEAVLTGPSGGTLLNLKTSEFRDIERLLPFDDAPSLRGAATGFAVSGGKAVLAALGTRDSATRGPRIQPGELMAWKSDGASWSPIELISLSEAGLENIKQFAVTSDRVGLFANSAMAGVALSPNRGDLFKAEYPQSDQTWRSATQVALSANHLWSLRGTSLFHADAESGKQDAFLPWNAAGIVPQTLAADGEVLWIGTNQGIKRLSLSKPDPETGYAGFVRARLGSEQDRPQTGAAQKLTDEIDAWQGTPYLWGGETRNGIDCSGFVMRAYQGVGVRLSHGSDWLRSCDMGRIVKDELVYGDVLIVPGHCMIYTGDGTTAETVSGGVGRASIWRRGSGVVIRRFLGVSDIKSKAFGSRSGGYGKPKSRSTKSRKQI